MPPVASTGGAQEQGSPQGSGAEEVARLRGIATRLLADNKALSCEVLHLQRLLAATQRVDSDEGRRDGDPASSEACLTPRRQRQEEALPPQPVPCGDAPAPSRCGAHDGAASELVEALAEVGAMRGQLEDARLEAYGWQVQVEELTAQVQALQATVRNKSAAIEQLALSESDTLQQAASLNSQLTQARVHASSLQAQLASPGRGAATAGVATSASVSAAAPGGQAAVLSQLVQQQALKLTAGQQALVAERRANTALLHERARLQAALARAQAHGSAIAAGRLSDTRGAGLVAAGRRTTADGYLKPSPAARARAASLTL